MALLTVVLLVVAATTSAIGNQASKAPNLPNSTIESSQNVAAADQNQNVQVLVETQSNLSIGKISKGDKLLTNATHYRKPCHDKVHVQDIVIKGNTNVEITAIKVTEVGVTQNAVVSIKEGGIGKNFVVIRLQSAKGGGYHYVTEVWGVKHKKKSEKSKSKALILISSK